MSSFLVCCRFQEGGGGGHSSSSSPYSPSSNTTTPRRKNNKHDRRRADKWTRRRRSLKQIATDGRSIASAVRSISMKSAGKQGPLAEEMQRMNSPKISSQVFTFGQMAIATNNFSSHCLVGEGGFGRVYKGYIPGVDQVVAVKQLDRNGLQGNREFLSEVFMLSLVDHPNLVNLIGYCADGDQRILVYEYMANGSLEDHLLDLAPNNEGLEWYTRMKIAEGAAKGLEYLHEQANPTVIYRDFKASNILLDEDFNPKLSDFGLARIGPTGDKDHVSTRVMGTYGYCAPEYAMTGQLTTKSDVYSFGVVFLELISGRRAIDANKPTDEQNLVTWAQPLFKDRKLFTLMADPLLKGKYPVKGLYQALAVAAMCLQEEASTRPLISDVVTALEYLSKPLVEDLGRENSIKAVVLPKGGEDSDDDVDEEDNVEEEEDGKEEQHKEEYHSGYMKKFESTSDFMM